MKRSYTKIDHKEKTCPTCGKKFWNKKHPNTKFCSIICSSNDPTKIKKSIETFKAINANPLIKAIRDAKSKATNAKPKIKNRRIANLRITVRTPEHRAFKSKIAKEVNSRIGHNENKSKTLKATLSCPEKRLEMRKAGIEAMQRPGIFKKIYNIKKKNGTLASSSKVQRKIYETKKKNGTFRSSKPEDMVVDFAREKFGTNDIKRPYRSKKYPFNADFYIKSLNIIIECHFNPRFHGYEPYDTTNPKHVAEIEVWRKKSEEINFKGNKKSSYLHAIHVRTISDPLKVITAKANGVNLLVFYTEEEAIMWIEKNSKE